MHKLSIAATHANQNFASESHFLNAPFYLPSLWGSLCKAPLSSSSDSGAFVSVCVRSSFCAHGRFSERLVCQRLHPPPLSSEDARLYCRQESTFLTIKHCERQFAGALFLSNYLFSFSSFFTFSVADEWTLLCFSFGNVCFFLKTRMASLLHCGEDAHNKESFNLQCDCQHSKTSAAGGISH